MLYPQINAFRQCLDLSGLWQFRADPDDVGVKAGWFSGLAESRPIAVPASWNDQGVEEHNFLGPGWYQVQFSAPWGWDGQAISLRFNSVHYIANVWLNGTWIGRHEGGHLPFSFVLTNLVAENNLLVVRVDGQLAPDRVPPGNVPLNPLDTFPNEQYPATSFDFFPYCIAASTDRYCSIQRRQKVSGISQSQQRSAARRVLFMCTSSARQAPPPLCAAPSVVMAQTS